MIDRTQKVAGYCLLVSWLATLCGCSSLGLSLWPAQFPLLSQTRQFSKANRGIQRLPNELNRSPVMEYFIEPGDRILVEPVDLDSDVRLTGDQQVQVDGSIDLGKYGRLRVAGMTAESIERAIAERIEELDGQPEIVNVQLVETNAAKVYVLGAVGSPGAYPIKGNEQVLDAILLAGGLTSTASPCDIILVRPTPVCACRVVLPVCYRQITQLGDVATNYQLQPGDRIVVGSRTLFEELAVWRQARRCPGCCESRCAEQHPRRAAYSNRFSTMLPEFLRPNPAGEQVEEVEAPNSDATESLSPIEDDSDLFLEPLGNGVGTVKPEADTSYWVFPAAAMPLK